VLAADARARQMLQIPNGRMAVISCGLHLDRRGVIPQNLDAKGVRLAHLDMG
jgi:hypothetical protein